MHLMIESDKKFQYSVAWIDSLHNKSRGIITCANHLNIDPLNPENFLNYENKSLTKAPAIIPNGILNKFTLRAFNEAWYRKSPTIREYESQSISKYFYPLDGIDNWNNIYGPQGFIQYQFVVPDEESKIIKKTLDILRENSSASFLTVLKRFGNSNPAPISFPKKGWTLAIDIPANIKGIYSLLDKLDEIIVSSNGRIYLAKDSRMSPQIFKSSYKDYKKWKSVKQIADPKNIFHSDLAERLLI